MPAISRQVGATNVYLPVFIPDATVSTGVGLANVSSTSVKISWYRNDMSAVSNYSAATGTLGTWATSSMNELSSSLALGWYAVSVPNGCFISGDSCVLHLYAYPNMAPVPVMIELTKTNNQSYVSTVNVLGAVNPVGVSTVTIPVGVSSISIPVGVSTGVLGVSSATIPFGVSSISTPVAASSLAIPVTVSSGVVSVSSATIPFGVSSISTPVAASSLAIPVTVSSGVVRVSSAAIPFGVSSIATDVTVSSGTIAFYEANADTFLNRDISTGGNDVRPVKEALYVLRNRVDVSSGIVYQTDDSTSSWGFAVSTTPGDPIYLVAPQ